jgi:CheY-like chemotaxis protein
MIAGPAILLVEDDESDIIFLKRAFEKVGLPYPLRIAETGKKAVDYLSGVGPYADRAAYPMPTHILMDLKLPEKSGLEILEWIRTRPELQELKVTILTSSSEKRDLRRARELGAACYLVKPMSFSVLTDMTRGIVEWVGTGRLPSGCQWPPETLIPAAS